MFDKPKLPDMMIFPEGSTPMENQRMEREARRLLEESMRPMNQFINKQMEDKNNGKR